MKLKTGLKAGQNSVNLTINIAQNSGEGGTATAGGVAWLRMFDVFCLLARGAPRRSTVYYEQGAHTPS
jgi:hypothetical protein